MNAEQIKVQKGKLLITWSEGKKSTFDLESLRNECPCAGCKGETILFKSYPPAKSAPLTIESFKIAAIEPVGGYAIQIAWKDGHSTGIYSWEYLSMLEKSI